MSDFAVRLTAAFKQGNVIQRDFDTSATSGPRGNWQQNAADYVRQNGGTIIEGWLSEGAGYYTKHCIVQHNDRMIEVSRQHQSPFPFVRHDLFPDDWNALGIFVTDFEAWSNGDHERSKPKKPRGFSLRRLLKA